MRSAGFFSAILGMMATVAFGDAPSNVQDLTQLSIEQLMQVDVVTASKKAQPLHDVPASVYMLIDDDIRRFGATSIPEALRLVPGVHVGMIDANKWAVAVRGFNGRYSNKLLVLIDGRSVYTPFFSGTYWDAQPPLFMEDIEHIEVVRGPGAALWGANAVNGVINIITKSAKETQGTLWVAGGGSEQKALGGVRVGSPLGENGCYRVYTLYQEYDNLEEDRYIPPTTMAGWFGAVASARTGTAPSTRASSCMVRSIPGASVNGCDCPTPTLPGDHIVDDRYTISGHYLMGTWNRERGATTDTVHLYYSHEARSPIELTEFQDTAYEGMVSGLPMFSRVYGTPDFRSEEVTAYELGYRCQPHPRLSLDISAFYNVYRNLRSFEPADPFLETDPVPHLVLPVYMSNKLHGRTYGFEVSANWNVTDFWALRLGYANLTYRLQHDPDSKDPFNFHSDSTSNTPRHQVIISSHLNLPGKWRMDAYLFVVDRLYGMDFISGYYRLDLSFGWHITKDGQLSLTLQNLLKRNKREFEHPLWERDSIPERAIYGRLLWQL
ncbi:MAG: hypothetical protein C4335_12050 [Armatimonadota bacterium]